MLFGFTLLVVSGLAGYVAYQMFRVPQMAQYEMSKMYFAAAVLAFLAYIFMLSMIVYAFSPEHTSSTEPPGKTIFDACIKIIPPLVTLIIGFYFGTSQGTNQPPTSGKKIDRETNEGVKKDEEKGDIEKKQ